MRIDLTQEIQEVYLHRFIHQLAKKLVTIFIPLYLLNAGFSHLAVILFYVVYLGTPLISSFPFAILASKVGYKRTSLLSAPLIFGFYFILRSLEAGSSLTYPVAFLGGLGFNMYWIGMNPEVAKSSKSEKRTEESGYFYSMSSLASAISPFLGGLILSVYSFNVLFLIAIALVLASFVPFLFNTENKDGMEIELVEFFLNFPKADFATYLVNGSLFLGKMLVWPFYLATVIQGSVSIGGAGTILAIGSTVTSASIGKISEKYGKVKIVSLGAIVTSITYILMSQVTTPMEAFLISGLNGLSFTVFTVPIFSTAMDHSESSDKLEYFAVREIALTLGRFITLLIFALAFFLLDVKTSFLVAFGILSLTALILPLIDRKMID